MGVIFINQNNDIGNCLPKANVANNLTTTNAGYALDARQGSVIDANRRRTDGTEGVSLFRYSVNNNEGGIHLNANAAKTRGLTIDSGGINNGLRIYHTYDGTNRGMIYKDPLQADVYLDTLRDRTNYYVEPHYDTANHYYGFALYDNSRTLMCSYRIDVWNNVLAVQTVEGTKSFLLTPA